jgi:ribosome biogenesis GTPase A
MATQIHWFPGHMKKAKDEISESVKLVDIIIEILDSRAPLSTANKDIEKLVNKKPKLVLLNKADLSDPIISNKWKEYFEKLGFAAILSNVNDKNIINAIEQNIEKIAVAKREREKRRGIKPQPIRALIIGIPNVGKSTLINRISKTKIAIVANKPGVTKSQRWIKVNKDFELLDTPGVLPMRYDDKIAAINLALIGSIKEEILPNEELADYLLSFLKTNYPHELSNRYHLKDINFTNNELLMQIAISRGFINHGQANTLLAAKTLLRETRNGILGCISFEEPPSNA